MRDGREDGSNHGAALWARETQKRRLKSKEAFQTHETFLNEQSYHTTGLAPK
jgi:hypothetical protein